MRVKRTICSSKPRNALATRAPPVTSNNAHLNFPRNAQQRGSGQPLTRPDFSSESPTFLSVPLNSFLATPPPFTLLPTPTPADANYKSPYRELDETQKTVFARSPLHQCVAVIDACLANLYDVPRARQLFNRMREDLRGHPLLEVRLYNLVLRAYLLKAHQPAVSNTEQINYINEFWSLYDVLSQAAEVEPNASTYALALVAHIRSTLTSEVSSVSSETKTRKKDPSEALRTALIRTPVEVISSALERRIPAIQIIMDHSLDLLRDISFVPESSKDEGFARPQVQVLGLISRSAVEMGNIELVNELASIEDAIDSAETSVQSSEEDPLHDVPEIRPVRKQALEGEEGQEQPIPFNLALLRSRLQSSEKTRRLLSHHISQSEQLDGPTEANKVITPATPVALVAAKSAGTPHFRQIELENLTYTIAGIRMRHEAEGLKDISRHGELGMKRQPIRRLMYSWHRELQEELKHRLDELGKQEAEDWSVVERQGIVKLWTTKTAKKRHALIHPLLSLISPSALSMLTIQELLRMQGSNGLDNGMRTTRAVINIGRAVEREWQTQLRRNMGNVIPIVPESDTLTPNLVPGSNSMEGSYTPTPYFYSQNLDSLYTARAQHRKLMEIDERWNWSSEWTQVARAKVGAFLVDALMNVAKIEVRIQKSSEDQDLEHPENDYYSEMHPAFFHSYEYSRGRKLGVIRLHSRVAEQMAKEPSLEELRARHLPMLVRPKPWIGDEQGGYLINKTSAMRYKNSEEQRVYMKEASLAGNLELVFTGLDVLGSTPWRINRAIFDVVLEVWNSGKGLGGIPPEKLDFPEPPRPDPNDPKARTIYMQKMQEIRVAKANNHSDRCNTNYKLEIARAFLADTFYFPHNLDFRGRAYPLPPHLNHIGDDLSRGLLVFAESRPLGSEGLKWLKIHLAGLYGYDKASFTERVEWVEERLEQIKDSAKNPLTGKRWWLDADDPWQCLATCMELTSALESTDPRDFESCLPVHQDGTCNGLQHYAALGGDDEGAKQVNLVDSDRPGDVYTQVALRVEKMIEEDVKNNVELANMCKGKISRKVVKQTVMTTVYGVTFVGARDQILKQLKDRGDFPVEKVWVVSAYITKKVIAAIGDLFKGAQSIMSWLTLCAKLIAKSMPSDRARLLDVFEKSLGQHDKLKKVVKEQMTTVIWTTPLGLPVVQPYRRDRRKQVLTSLQSIYLSDPNEPTEVNVSKQTTAFPPNFIHSLDATHMMLTALECRANNITFASVHDSYWTHASHVNKMSEIIRDTFVALHSSDVLGKVDEEFRTRYANHKIPITSLRTKLFGILETIGVSKGSRIKWTKRYQELFVKALRGEIAPPPEFDAALSSRTRRRAVIKREETESLESYDIDAEEKSEDSEDSEETMNTAEDTETDADVQTAFKVFDQRYIDLVKLLPPVPKKGEFDVNAIKRSQYFFS